MSRPVRWTIDTIPADVAAKLPSELWEVLENNLHCYATPASRSAAAKDRALKCYEALTAMRSARFGF